VADQPDAEELFDALYGGDAARVRDLLARGVPPDATNRAGEPALRYAASHGRDECIVALLEAGVTRAPLPMVEAALPADTSVLRRLLALGGDPNATDERGWTPLMEAAHWGNAEAVRVLLAGGADPARRTVNGMTAAEVARAEGHAELARLLDTATGTGYTAIR
jgi:uncharacterized protein